MEISLAETLGWPGMPKRVFSSQQGKHLVPSHSCCLIAIQIFRCAESNSGWIVKEEPVKSLSGHPKTLNMTHTNCLGRLPSRRCCREQTRKDEIHGRLLAAPLSTIPAKAEDAPKSKEEIQPVAGFRRRLELAREG